MQNFLLNSSLIKDYALELGTKVKHKFELILLPNSHLDNSLTLEFQTNSKAKTN